METLKIEKNNVKMIAHRGLSGLEKENTAVAFVAAGNKSFYGIETDIHLTKDNVFVVPLKKGLRFAVCAVSEEKCAAAPSIIKNALEYVRSQNLAKA